ncbi:MAG TPA: flavodoxin family protein [Methanothrix sp.]|jgi:multimeric flavodoxin WrbA|uniref:flavodoxin family protein n=1 Tax=Methanothrix sp. TaxID=90426 RepID=UPI002C448B0F|nr:flavodoxin family protein [Methanothrix sp.]MDI9416696.1 flavodoxin family protein [Euryarchaeota archaeon]HON35991.1 flavodoxin family protein [Methanothrix sp.]HRU76352.1 flavodoxin family protein [Methanothrix sp.]
MILGISGSPRKMATEHILGVALSMLEERGYETQLFTMRGKSISPCRHCDYCLKNKECIVKDDMYQLYPLIREAEGYVLATPVYNGSMSAQMKIAIDRTRATLAADPRSLRRKPGMAIAVGGDRMGGQELAVQQIHTFYVLNGMIPVSGGFFGANLGATFWSHDTLEEAKKDDEGFRSLRKTVRRFAETLEWLRSNKAKDSGE